MSLTYAFVGYDIILMNLEFLLTICVTPVFKLSSYILGSFLMLFLLPCMLFVTIHVVLCSDEERYEKSKLNTPNHVQASKTIVKNMVQRKLTSSFPFDL